MDIVDYKFFYKNSVRSLLIYKNTSIINTNGVPSISKLLFVFVLRKMEDIDDTQVYNYLYLFRFFFGRRAFITKYRSYFSLGKWSYSFSVALVIKKADVYNVLSFILCDIITATEKSYLSFGRFSSEAFYLIFKDINIFSEKKTNLGLFSLKSNLDFRIYCTGTNSAYPTLLRNLKLYNF